jgi:hypothetical protein
VSQPSWAALPNRRLLLSGRERLRRRGVSFSLVCGGCGTPRSRSAARYAAVMSSSILTPMKISTKDRRHWLIASLALAGIASRPPDIAGQRPQAIRIGKEVLLGPAYRLDSVGQAVPLAMSCSHPGETIGFVRGFAHITYILRSNRRPDFTTLEADSAEGLSREGATSVAKRALRRCKFQGGRPTSGLRITQWVKFHDLDSAPPNGVLGWAPDDTVESSGSQAELLFSPDQQLDELPRLLRCKYASGFEQGPTFEAVLTVTQSGQTKSRSLRVWGLVEPERTSKRIILSDGHWLSDCQWTPGRSHGKAVAVRGRIIIGGGLH